MSRIKCEILEISPERVKFALNNCDVSLANSLRRTLIAEVPTMAPHLITVYENTSVLHDEFLAQRIGLIPFYSQSVDKYQYPWKCNCSAENSDDCQTCKVQFRLQVHHKGVGDSKYENVREVTSLDIEPVYPMDEADTNFRKPVMPVRFQSEVENKKQVGIPIVKLNKGEQINIRFEVQKGIGKMHSRWAPTEIATFQPDPQIRINNEIETSILQKQEIRDSCPRKVYEIHNGVLEAASPENCIFCGECQKKAEMISMERLKNFIKVGKKKDRFIFTVESVGSMEAATIVKKGIIALRQKLESIEKLIDNA